MDVLSSFVQRAGSPASESRLGTQHMVRMRQLIGSSRPTRHKPQFRLPAPKEGEREKGGVRTRDDVGASADVHLGNTAGALDLHL